MFFSGGLLALSLSLSLVDVLLARRLFLTIRVVRIRQTLNSSTVLDLFFKKKVNIHGHFCQNTMRKRRTSAAHKETTEDLKINMVITCGFFPRRKIRVTVNETR